MGNKDIWFKVVEGELCGCSFDDLMWKILEGIDVVLVYIV